MFFACFEEMWLISSREENKCCYKLSKYTKWHLFYSFWVKIVVILSDAELVSSVIFFSAWDKSHVKWDNSWNWTLKKRTFMTAHFRKSNYASRFYSYCNHVYLLTVKICWAFDYTLLIRWVPLPQFLWFFCSVDKVNK